MATKQSVAMEEVEARANEIIKIQGYIYYYQFLKLLAGASVEDILRIERSKRQHL